MIFRVREAERSLERYTSTWAPKEIELETYLLPPKTEDPLLYESVFREQVAVCVRKRVFRKVDVTTAVRGMTGMMRSCTFRPPPASCRGGSTRSAHSPTPAMIPARPTGFCTR